MKPSWDDAPKWAGWLVMNSNGDWFWCEHRPAINSAGAYWFVDRGRTQVAWSASCWTETLEDRPI